MQIDNLASVGPKPVAKGMQAVCSSSQPNVTDTMIQVMKDGGNAVDAAIAGCLIQSVVEPHMTNHAGTVMLLYWDAKTGKAYQLNSMGTLVPDMAPFRPIPPIGIRFATAGMNPCACIPGFMPALGEIHRRFGTKPWAKLCEPAVTAAENGHLMTSFEYGVLQEELRCITYFPSGRALFTPDGFVPEVGDVFKNPALAHTLLQLAVEGPAYFTEGNWAQHFVAEANRMGWPITMQHMTAIPPRWQEPLRYEHRGSELIQLSPPERTGVFTAFVLGVLKNFDLPELGHYTESAETLYLMAHALRRADWELGLLQDPEMFDVPVEHWLSSAYHKMVADIIWHSRPRVDLTNHIRLTSGAPSLVAAGLPAAGAGTPHPPVGSCELSIVDPQGNWAQVMNTLQGGGIPGVVVDGVPMVGSHARSNLMADISGWFTGGGRIKSIIGSTFVLRDGQPWLGMGTPGNVYGTMPQVLSSILDYGIDPYEASVLPRMDPLRDDYVLEIESRLPEDVVRGLAERGVQVRPLPMYDYNMGSFQICWRDTQSGLLFSSADPRRAGKASGF
ncbi:MAG: gamma-glutamyltransferase family protein [Anaerolineaceae bacterium]|nr:gamma-glutamyltransferase family protein [Anaerolineaceae bacterium]